MQFLRYTHFMFQVTMGEFSGPMDKLLELIEAKKLDITQVSLAEVTGDFIAYIESFKERAIVTLSDGAVIEGDPQSTHTRVLAEFLVVASQLILIKSRMLVPDAPISEEERETIVDLERRLKIYRELKPLFALLKTTWASSPQLFSRQAYAAMTPMFYPAPNMTQGTLVEAMERLVSSLGSLATERETIERQIISLEEKIIELLAMMDGKVQQFSDVVSRKSRQESVVLFLALLHLLRDHRLSAHQDGLFNDIAIQKV
jgi:segregation and condensation protein A